MLWIFCRPVPHQTSSTRHRSSQPWSIVRAAPPHPSLLRAIRRSSLLYLGAARSRHTHTNHAWTCVIACDSYTMRALVWWLGGGGAEWRKKAARTATTAAEGPASMRGRGVALALAAGGGAIRRHCVAPCWRPRAAAAAPPRSLARPAPCSAPRGRPRRASRSVPLPSRRLALASCSGSPFFHRSHHRGAAGDPEEADQHP